MDLQCFVVLLHCPLLSIIHFFILDADHLTIGKNKYIPDEIQEQDRIIESESEH